ncbi:serine/threonine-protein kinase Chk1-like [Oratosquilla oratoria]|uniref:serine/threonine-protein kinase Chk1-like n=1 Tax=Oratosquilla oratoria TaxID=337810 RepID=UPI003F773637
MWKKVKQIGSGSFGKVTLEKHRITKELVAVKRCSRLGMTCVDREEVVHSQLNHENIIKLFYWDLKGDKVYMYLEYGTEGSLITILRNLTKEEVFIYFNQLMSGVEYLHSRGVAHRDLKPGNLMITKNRILKISDFGYAGVFLLCRQEVMLTGSIGTRPYMAPEIFKKDRYRGPPVDLWSCGIILFVMATSTHPWEMALETEMSYRCWLLKDLSLLLKAPWSRLCEAAWSIITCLLSSDPLERLSSWHEHPHRQPLCDISR